MMELVDVLGYISAFVIGTILGLIGGGGSILTVPVLVYMLAMSPVLATAYSLFVVGASASVGAFKYMQKGLVDFKTAIVFAIPSFIAVFLTRYYLMPALPDVLFNIGETEIGKDLAIMTLFGIIMLIAALSMIRSKKDKVETNSQRVFNYPLIIIDGLLVGTLTGVVGAGGGFLIIPALVLIAKLPMKLAVGTSLLIIAIKSLIGFIGDVQSGQAIDWQFLLIFTGLSICGIFLGSYWSDKIPSKQLKKGFGWFVLVMAILILIKEILIN